MRFSDDDRGGMEEREGNRGERRAVRAVAARGALPRHVVVRGKEGEGDGEGGVKRRRRVGVALGGGRTSESREKESGEGRQRMTRSGVVW